MDTPTSTFCVPFAQISSKDIQKVGGKNASLGEMFQKLQSLDIKIPDGFAITAEAYWEFLNYNHLRTILSDELQKLNLRDLSNLSEIGAKCREYVQNGHFPKQVEARILEAYRILNHNGDSFAVRSSATAEDLPSASFAGQHDSFLNIKGPKNLLEAIHRCYVSLFNDRAIKYRIDHDFDHMKVALSVGIQKMVRADLGSAGVAFTLDPESGFANVIYITSSYGLGENIVQGAVTPDEFYCFKPSIAKNQSGLLFEKLGTKEQKMVYNPSGTKPIANIPTSTSERNSFSLSHKEVSYLARCCYQIETHYQTPMDIEWAKDGLTGEIFIVQARPETVHSLKRNKDIVEKRFTLNTQKEPICTGKAVGRSIASGTARIIKSLEEADKVQKGDIIIADTTNPDWNAILRKAISIVTNKGGRTSHASIIARELGIHAVVGTTNATEKIKDGQVITVSCIQEDEGKIYDGKLEWQEETVQFEQKSTTHTNPMFVLADPFQAFRLSRYPNAGVGLLRMEFIIANVIKIHPMALASYQKLPAGPDKEKIAEITSRYPDKRHYFTDILSQHLSLVAAAFYPKDVIIRMSDFKSNEYAQLLGGNHFEPKEENPMLGFRGASRYYRDEYKAGFALECEAIRILRENMGMDNVKIMIPFCRTIEEGNNVLKTLKKYGLERGKNGLEVYVMAEIPSNIILAREFAQLFDGFSIGSNDLTQLTLGIDRDSTIINDLFDENNEAVKYMISYLIKTAHSQNSKVGLCGQAPSDFPDFTRFLVEQGIDSISFNPDALLKGINNIQQAEKALAMLPKQ